jgi:hypothetical protein
MSCENLKIFTYAFCKSGALHQLMHNELRYQAKTHAISNMPSKEKSKIPVSSPPNIYIYIFFLKIKIKTCYKGKKTLITLACGKIKPVFQREGIKITNT